MSTFAHSVRRRVSLLTTRSKKIEKNISAEYTTQKHALLRQKETLEKAIDMVKKQAHSEFANSYKTFSELICGDAPADTPLFTKSRTASEAVNKINTASKTPIPKESPSSRLLAHVSAYLAELKTIEKEFHTVEAAYVEVDRYEKKVGKLNQKSNKENSDANAKADKIADKARRNVDKLETQRATYQTKLDATIEMMKKSNAKYEKILDCVFTAFWITEDDFITTTNSTTQEIRDQAKQDQTELIELDVAKM